MGNYTPIVVRIRASLIPVSVLGHPILESNPHTFRVQPEPFGDAKPDAFGGVIQVVGCSASPPTIVACGRHVSHVVPRRRWKCAGSGTERNHAFGEDGSGSRDRRAWSRWL